MNKKKLAIKREASKRMIQKNMDPDYIKEITKLSKRQIRDIQKINDSFIGDNDHYMRKQYASAHNLHFTYYFKDKIMFYTGVDIEKSEFYKNRYMQNGHMDLKDNIDKMEKYYANTLRLKSMKRMINHINFDEELLMACNVPYSWPENPIYYTEIYRKIKFKIKDFEKEKMVINLLAVEKNLKKIAFICNVKDEMVENIKDKNAQFFKNGKLNLEKIKDENNKWKAELEYEIAKRTTNSYPAIEINSRIFDIKKEELEEFFEQNYSQKGLEYNIRKEIVENLMQDSHSPQEISEISSIEKFYVNLIADKKYYNRYLKKYYDKYANEKLIDYKI